MIVRNLFRMALVLALLALGVYFEHAYAVHAGTIPQVLPAAVQNAGDLPSAGTTYTVVNSADTNIGCTLRIAILSAEGAPPSGFPCGADHGAPYTIDFNIAAGGVQTIYPIGGNMTISRALTIDGTTQPGCAKYPCIVIDGYWFSPNPFALVITASNSVVRGLVLNDKAGLEIDGGSANLIEGNYIGTDITGTLAANGAGIYIHNGATDNIIGGTTAAARNLLCGTVSIWDSGTSGNVVEGNYIGTDLTGSSALGNCNDGVVIYQATNNTIGGTAAGAGNLISGNQNYGGVRLASAKETSVEGNLIGTDVSGTKAISNSTGIEIVGDGSASNNIIGGTNAAARNIISGNTGDGISMSNERGDRVEGNFIGTDISGTAQLGNGFDGVSDGSGLSNTIGGTTTGAGNLIAGNKRNGVYLNGVSGDVVEGNFIGTDGTLTGTLVFGVGSCPCGNAFGNAYGVYINDSLSASIGGTSPGAANRIAFNTKSGVVVGINVFDPSAQNAIRGNSIYANGTLGIDLANDGVTPNASGCSGAIAANGSQNYPVLNYAAFSGGKTFIAGTLNCVPNTIYALDFFASAAASTSGHGEGQTFLGTFTTTTDGSGNAAFNAQFATASTLGQFISATATDPLGDTSEFAQDVPVPYLAFHVDLPLILR